jgi:hypothetical protein
MTSSPMRERAKRSDNSVHAQRATVLAMLRHGARSTYEFRAQGISHPAQRVKELRALGCEIESSRVIAIDSDGFSHPNVAMYTLTFEPARYGQQPI